MSNKATRIEIVRQDEVAVRALQGVVRFITVTGRMPEIPIAAGVKRAEMYTGLVGPVLTEHQFLGAACLPSISSVDSSSMRAIQCSMDSAETEWDRESGRVELRIQLSTTGGPGTATILFSVTILAAV
jgi:hypothetical protein